MAISLSNKNWAGGDSTLFDKQIVYVKCKDLPSTTQNASIIINNTPLVASVESPGYLNDLIAHFNGTFENDIPVDIINGYNPTTSNVVQVPNGKYGAGISFVDNYFRLNTIPLPTQAEINSNGFSIAFWLKRIKSATYCYLFSLYTAYNKNIEFKLDYSVLRFDADSNASGSNHEYKVNYSEPVSDIYSIWNHLIFSFRSSYIDFYVNGVFRRSIPFDAYDLNSSIHGAIGSSCYGGTYNHNNGAIFDEIKFINRSITAEEAPLVLEDSVIPFLKEDIATLLVNEVNNNYPDFEAEIDSEDSSLIKLISKTENDYTIEISNLDYVNPYPKNFEQMKDYLDNTESNILDNIDDIEFNRQVSIVEFEDKTAIDEVSITLNNDIVISKIVETPAYISDLNAHITGEIDGNAIVDTINGNLVPSYIIGDGLKTAEGKYGNGIDLTNTTALVFRHPFSMPDLDYGLGWTIGFWIKRITNTSDAQYIFACAGTDTRFGFRLAMDDHGITLTGSHIDIDDNYFGPDLPINEWHHITLSLGEITASIYLDGVKYKTATINPNNGSDYDNFIIFGMSYSGYTYIKDNPTSTLYDDYFCESILDDIKILNRSVTDEEVPLLMLENDINAVVTAEYFTSEIKNSVNDLSDYTAEFFEEDETILKIVGPVFSKYDITGTNVKSITNYASNIIDINNKVDIGHSHTESDITNLDKYTQAEVDSLCGYVEGPITPISEGTKGQWSYDSTANYIFRCVDDDTWVRYTADTDW